MPPAADPDDVAAARTQLRRLLEALQAADDAGDVEAGRQLREALVHERFARRVVGDGRATPLDVALLMKLAWELGLQAQHEASALVYAAARGHAEAIGDDASAAQAGLGAAGGLIALLDLDAAEVLLAQVPDTRELVGARAFAAGRLSAARGALGRADEQLSRALEVASGPRIVKAELALMLAEVRIDRGDFAGFEALRTVWAPHDVDASLGLRWQLLLGTVQQLQGRLGAAERTLRAVLHQPAPDTLAAAVLSARWQYVQLLGLLNRLDEAEAALTELEAGGGGGDCTLLRALLAARRSTVPIVSRRRRAADEVGESEDLADPLGAVMGPEPPVRRNERAAIDWAELSNRLQLHLHHGQLDAATEALGWLSVWRESFDSPLIAARYDHLVALVALAHGHWTEAAERAQAAQDACAALGLTLAEWNLSRLRCVILASSGRGSAEEVRRHQQYASGLLAAMCGDLDVRDRIQFRLNKWTPVEERISALCRGCPSEDVQTARVVLQSIVDLRLWDTVPETDPGAPPTATATATVGGDLYALAEVQAELWRDHANRRASTRAVAPSWLRGDTAVAHYVVLPDRVELFLLYDGYCRRIELDPIPRTDLWELVRRALGKLQYHRWYADARDPAELARRLGLADISRRLPRSVTNLLIVPDGALAHVPFCGLPLAGEPLMMRYALAFAPRWGWHHSGLHKARRYSDALGVAVADASAAVGQEMLPAVDLEIDGLRHLTRRNHYHPLIDRKARRADVLASLQRVELVHLACHGRFDVEHPTRSGLLLDDGWLTIEDLKNLELSGLRLAIVAACEGATSLPLPGSEAISLPVALLLRGAHAVAAALWRIPSDATREFMGELHAALLRQGPFAAMTMVQRASFSRDLASEAWCGYMLHVCGAPPRWWARLRLLLP